MTDTWINFKDKKILLKKQDPFMILFEAIHHDPKQWVEPHLWEPERFNTRDKSNKWTRDSEGNPRNPLSFTPFMGGKRICLGKTFAEVTVKYTVPMIFHHLDFEFATESQKTEPKKTYAISGVKELVMLMKMSIKK